MPERNLHTHAQLSNDSTKKVASFLDSVSSAYNAGETNRDIAAAIASGDSAMQAPDNLASVIVAAPESRQQSILDSVTKGIERYKAEHGVAPTADLVEAAISQGAASMFGRLDKNGNLLDSLESGVATGSASESTSLQANRAIVSTLACLSEAVPFAGYLPADIKSNESKLVIVSHVAGSTYGDYKEGDLFNGVQGG